MMMDLRKPINFLVDICILESSSNLWSKYSAHSTYYLGMTFIKRERIALLESKFHFQIEYCNVPTVALFQIRNAD